ncbi:hypothetical protein EYF80_018734 [Liparis tanakae]|uniref:Uncharacterized protein n=1 Tax=Liparis tanakae TaxID=230148 RepID=A0A4Z2I1H0_9TELE|nr:hypothetical protein EYF80_018734 [Liparis tanakae]
MGPFTDKKRCIPAEILSGSIERNLACKNGDESLQKGHRSLGSYMSPLSFQPCNLVDGVALAPHWASYALLASCTWAVCVPLSEQ